MKIIGEMGSGTVTIRFYLDRVPTNEELGLIRSTGFAWKDRHSSDKATRLNDLLIELFPFVKGGPVLQVFYAYNLKNEVYFNELMSEITDIINNRSTLYVKKAVVSAFPEGFNL